MNLTLSIDDVLVERAREVAREQGTSLNALIRDFIEQLAGQSSGEQLLADFQEMWSVPGDSGTAAKFDRAAVYSERLGRYRR